MHFFLRAAFKTPMGAHVSLSEHHVLYSNRTVGSLQPAILCLLPFAHAVPGTWSEPLNNPPTPFSFFKCEDFILPLRSHQMSFHVEIPPGPIQLDILLPSWHLHGARTSARSDLSFSFPWIRGTYCVRAPSP